MKAGHFEVLKYKTDLNEGNTETKHASIPNSGPYKSLGRLSRRNISVDTHPPVKQDTVSDSAAIYSSFLH